MSVEQWKICIVMAYSGEGVREANPRWWEKQ